MIPKSPVLGPGLAGRPAGRPAWLLFKKKKKASFFKEKRESFSLLKKKKKAFLSKREEKASGPVPRTGEGGFWGSEFF